MQGSLLLPAMSASSASLRLSLLGCWQTSLYTRTRGEPAGEAESERLLPAAAAPCPFPPLLSAAHTPGPSPAASLVSCRPSCGEPVPGAGPAATPCSSGCRLSGPLSIPSRPPLALKRPRRVLLRQRLRRHDSGTGSYSALARPGPGTSRRRAPGASARAAALSVGPGHSCAPLREGETRSGRLCGPAPPARPRALARGVEGEARRVWPGGKHPLILWPEVGLRSCSTARGFFKGQLGGGQLDMTLQNWVVCGSTLD